jgi:hypothetical protein
MKTNRISRTAIFSVAFSFLAGAGAMLAQDPQTGPPPARTQQQTAPANAQVDAQANAPANAQANDDAAPSAQAPADQAPPANAAPQSTMDPNYSQGPPPAQYPNRQYPDRRYGNQPPQAGNYNRGPVPAKLTIKPGTYLTVRLNQGLSSDRNQVGDGFTATLAKPVVVDGVVVAERGETLGGKVIEARKAGRVEGVSRLAVQLTDLTLADGLPVPIQTLMFSRNGPTSVGRDVGTVAATTATGAAIGAAAGWGTGAAIGAGAGALAGIVGVLVTRGHATYLYPEQMLTFRVEAPITVSTESAPQAFRWVGPEDYDRPYDAQNRGRAPNSAYYGAPYGAPYGDGSPYPYTYAYGYPYYWGPGFGVYWGRGYGGRGYWGRGFGGRGWRR